jgi:hypothetical protein
MSWTTTLLALPPIGVFFLSDVLNRGFAWKGAAPKLAELSPAATRLDASGRLLMLAAALVVFGLSYLIVLRFIADLRDEFGPRTRTWLLGWYAGGALLGTLWIFKVWTQVAIDSQLGMGFLEYAFDALGAAGGTSGDNLMRGFHWLTQGSRLAVALAAGIVVVGGVSTLVDPIGPLEREEMHAFLLHQRRRLRTYVNVGAALLVAYVALQIAWMRWPLAALDSATAMTLAGHIDALAIYTGVTGSVVIALFAVPASTILAARAAALPQMQGVADGPPLLDASLLPSLGKVLVILAPTLAGSLPTIVEALGNMAGA